MAHLDNARGTFVLDKRVAGIGRIKRASGTKDRKTFKRLADMIDQLVARGRLDLLEALRDGVVTPLQLWDAYRRDDLDRLPSAETVAPLWRGDDPKSPPGAVDRWLASWKKSEHHKRATTSTFNQLKKLAPAGGTGARVGDLVELLRKYQAACERAETATSFNRARSHVQAFLREALGRSHRLYREAGDLARLKPQGEGGGRPFTVAALDELCERLETRGLAAHAQIARTMALTGMGPGEMWGRWTVEGEKTAEGDARRVRIHGTKREGRKRLVPYIEAVQQPARHPRTFANAFTEAAPGHVVYDLRRTFAHLLEEAGIPRARRKLYLGHRSGDVTDLYEKHEVDSYLAADGAKLRAYLATQRAASAREGRGDA